MNENSTVSVGSALLVISSALVLLYALPSSPIPAVLAVLAALGMAAGSLLVGVSDEAV